MRQAQSRQQQRQSAHGGNGFSWLLTSTLSLFLIVGLISIGSSRASHARTFHDLQDAPAASESDPIRISSENASHLCISSWSDRALWQRFAQSEHVKPSTADAVLTSPSCQQLER